MAGVSSNVMVNALPQSEPSLRVDIVIDPPRQPAHHGRAACARLHELIPDRRVVVVDATCSVTIYLVNLVFHARSRSPSNRRCRCIARQSLICRRTTRHRGDAAHSWSPAQVYQGHLAPTQPSSLALSQPSPVSSVLFPHTGAARRRADPHFHGPLPRGRLASPRRVAATLHAAQLQPTASRSTLATTLKTPGRRAAPSRSADMATSPSSVVSYDVPDEASPSWGRTIQIAPAWIRR